jgi:hypothetical protein
VFLVGDQKLDAYKLIILVDEAALAFVSHHALALVLVYALPHERLFVRLGHDWHRAIWHRRAPKQIFEDFLVRDIG